MPTVPVAVNRQTLRPVADGGYRAADFASGSLAVGAAAQDLGRGLDLFAAKTDEAAAKQLDIEYTAFESQVLYGSPDGKTKGYAQLEGIEADAALPSVQEQLKQKRDEILAKAGGGRRQAMLAPVLQGREVQTNTLIARHHQDQMRRYQDATDAAFIQTNAQLAVQNYRDPEVFDRQVQTTLLAVEGKEAKWGLDYARLKRAETQTAIYSGVVDSISATGDNATALEWLNKNRYKMIPAEYDKQLARLRPAVEEQEAEEVADSIRGVAGAIFPEAPVAVTDLLDGIKWMEHRGGDPTRTSPAGARGMMQVMPATAKEIAGELGIPYDEKRLSTDHEYNQQIGTAYLAKLAKMYDNNPTLVLAAYNGGMGRVNEWIKKYGDPRKGEISSGEWAARIPITETREYVAGALRFGAGPQRGPKNKPADPDINTQLATADAMAEEQGWSPEKRKRVKQNILSSASLDRQLLADQQGKAYDAALTMVNAGRPVPPKLFEAMTPIQARTVQNEAERAAKGENVRTDFAVYGELADMTLERPADFADLDLNAYVGKISTDDLRAFKRQQIAIRSSGGEPDEVLVRRVARDTFKANGIVLTGKKGPANEERAKVLEDTLAREAAAWSKANGGKVPDRGVLQKIADAQMIEAYAVDAKGYREGDPRPRFEVDTPNAELIGIPTAYRQDAQRRAQARLGRPLTTAEMADAWNAERGTWKPGR